MRWILDGIVSLFSFAMPRLSVDFEHDDAAAIRADWDAVLCDLESVVPSMATNPE